MSNSGPIAAAPSADPEPPAKFSPSGATVAGWLVFLAIFAGGGIIVIKGNSHSFEEGKSTTTIVVTKGRAAGRIVIRSTPGDPSSPAAGGAVAPRRQLERKSERPRGGTDSVARTKTTTETHPAALAEQLIGEQGPVLLQLAALFLFAFVGAAISQRLVTGNYRFKIGALDLSYEAAAIESARFGVELQKSVASLAERIEQLEDVLVEARLPKAAKERAPELGEHHIPVPAAEPHVREFIRSLSTARQLSGRPADEQELAVRIAPPARRRDEDEGTPPESRERGHGSAPEDAGEESSGRAGPTPTEANAPAPGGGDHEEIVAAMEGLLAVAEKLPFRWGEASDTPVSATIARSQQTYEGICQLLRADFQAQAAMLVFGLYEDVVVAHRMFSLQDPTEVSGSVGPLGRPTAESRAGLRALARELEMQALFSPRLSSGTEPLLTHLGDLIHDWFDRAAHPTALDLPFAPGEEKLAQLTGNQASLIGFTASWLFAQQIYLRFEIDEKRYRVDAALYEEFNATWLDFLTRFAGAALAAGSADRLVADWKERYGGEAPS